MAALQELAPGLWRWATPHPEWSAGAFGATVAGFALETERWCRSRRRPFV